MGSSPKLSSKWIKETRNYFLMFLKETKFPFPERHGVRGTKFSHPEWIIMFISILAVKCKVKTYMGIHRMAERYWPLITADKSLPPISERQLRDRLKKIGHKSGKAPGFIFQIFPEEFFA